MAAPEPPTHHARQALERLLHVACKQDSYPRPHSVVPVPGSNLHGGVDDQEPLRTTHSHCWYSTRPWPCGLGGGWVERKLSLPIDDIEHQSWLCLARYSRPLHGTQTVLASTNPPIYVGHQTDRVGERLNPVCQPHLTTMVPRKTWRGTEPP